MSNPENLKPFTSDQSHEEAVKNGRKGGKASGKVRRAKAVFRELLADNPSAFLSADQMERLRRMGVDTEGKTFLEAAAVQTLYAWLSGDQSAGKLFLSVAGMDEAAERRELEQKRLELEREKFDWMKNGKAVFDDDMIELANSQLLNLADLINHPKPSRDINEFAVEMPEESEGGNAD